MRRLMLIMLGLLFVSTQLLAQNRTVSGSVLDSLGQAVPSVTVRVPGTKLGSVTDARGTFTISVPQATRSLEFSSVGYNTQVLPIPASGSFNVTMHQTSSALNEVVVTGITRTRRSQFAGASTKLDAEQLNNKPVGSLDQLFQGRVPGLLALTGSGQPGNATTVIIRGQGSIQGGTSPLYIVDGIPVEAGVFQSLNPNDFLSVDVLRDASASALYGSRGSSGVIVITTKRGQSGKMKLSYSGQMGVKQRPDFTWDMMNTQELFAAQEKYGKFLGLTGSDLSLPGWYYSKNNPRYTALTATEKAQVDAIYDSMSKINNNWRDVFLRDGSFSNHQIAISGGTGKTRIYTSLALYNEEGITYRTDMKRGTLRNNVDYADDKLSVAVSSQLGYSKRNFQQSTTTNSTGNPFLVANLTAPYASLYSNGALATGTGNKFAGANAYELTMLDQNYNDQLKTTLGLTSSYKITEAITAGLTSGIDFRETQSSNYGNKTAYTRRTSTTPTGQAGFMTEGLTRSFQVDIRPSLGFRKLFNAVHDVDVTAFAEYIKQADKTTSATGYGIDPRTPNTPAAITQGDATNQLYANVSGGKGQNTIVSGLIIGRYSFTNKYTLTGSFRRDGSSKLPENTRWQNYYSVGAIWDVAKEDFLKANQFVNTLRVKASYGGSGNYDNFPGGNYPYQAQYVASGTYAGISTEYATYPGNPEMKWETTWVTNLGLDFGFINNRIWGDVNVYDKRTKDLFVRKTLSATSGFGSINVNAGELQNKGFEVNLNGDVVRKRDLVFSLNANVGYNHNEVLSLGGEPDYPLGTGKITVGLPLGSHYEIEWAGVDAASGAPLYYDAKGKLTSDVNAAVKVQKFGTWEAPWKGGFGGNVRFKSFEISTVFSWQKGARKSNNLEYFMENPNGFIAGGWNQAKTLNFWTKPGDVATTPSPLYNVAFSSKIIHDADFLRWKDLTISYALPKTVTGKIGFISNARVFVQGTNLKIWTNWQGMDPEAGPVNINLSEFPNPRAITGGLDITF